MSKKDAEFEGFLRGLETARKTALETEEDGGCVSDVLEKMIRQRRTTGVTLGLTKKGARRGNIDHEVLLLQLGAGNGNADTLRTEPVGS